MPQEEQLIELRTFKGEKGHICLEIRNDFMEKV